MKNVKLIIIGFFVFFFNLLFVNASNKIYSIDVDVKLNDDGSANIKEIWDMKLDNGTEVYKPMTNLGNSEISNFKVVDEKNHSFNFSSWDTNGSLSSKKYKNGFNYINNGLELCWGMGSYGKHKYTISYDVSNFIYNISDAQVLYWKFINNNMNPAPNKIYVTVSGSKKYEDTLDVWGYGYKGYAYVSDGKIEMESEKSISSSEYAVLLVKFPLNTFNTTNTNELLPNTFDEVLNKAETGTFEYDYDSNYSSENNFNIFDLFGFIPVFMVVFAIFGVVFKVLSSSSETFAEGARITPDEKKNTLYFREIPCDKNILKSFYISKAYKLIGKKTDLLGAILLKWLKEKRVTIIQTETKKFFKTKTVTAIDMRNNMVPEDIMEAELYNMMKTASHDDILESQELENWCNNNYSKFFNWFDKVEQQEKLKLVSEGKISESVTGKVFKSKTYTIQPSLKEDGIKLLGLKKFLNEFSSIKDKKAVEVVLWEYYLIYAQIFGIAKKVAEEFKNLYPELIEQSNLNYTDIIFINNISSRSISSASSARSRAESYSSGGGGFSSGGGGGGSFGGGSGGGTR